jgi:site-specific DNA recombinase
VLGPREERAERRTVHIAASRKRAAETDAKLKRLYDAIENGIADLADPMLKDRIAELKATDGQAHADAERAEGALDRLGPSITPRSLNYKRGGLCLGSVGRSGGRRGHYPLAMGERRPVAL